MSYRCDKDGHAWSNWGLYEPLYPSSAVRAETAKLPLNVPEPIRTYRERICRDCGARQRQAHGSWELKEFRSDARRGRDFTNLAPLTPEDELR